MKLRRFYCNLRLCSLLDGHKDNGRHLRAPIGVRVLQAGVPVLLSFILKKFENVFATTVICFCFIRDMKMLSGRFLLLQWLRYFCVKVSSENLIEVFPP
jgi:hypothetical protein